MDRAVMMLSGGFDSASIAAIYKSRGVDLYGITINYGQEHSPLDISSEIATYLNFKDYKVVNVISDNQIEIKTDLERQLVVRGSVTVGFFIMLKYLAAGYAVELGITDVISGMNTDVGLDSDMGRVAYIGDERITIHYPYVDEFDHNKELLGYTAISTELITPDQLYRTIGCYSNPPCGECVGCKFKNEFFRGWTPSQP